MKMERGRLRRATGVHSLQSVPLIISSGFIIIRKEQLDVKVRIC